MKFVNLKSAKNLSPGKVVFIQTSTGEKREAKLVERTENTEGVKFVFEVPAYFNKQAPSINPVLITDVVSVCVIQDKAVKIE